MQVAPDGQIGDDVNVQFVRRADAAAQQDGRRRQRARRQHDQIGGQLPHRTTDRGHHSGGTRALEHDPVDQRSRVDSHPGSHRRSVGAPRGDTAAFASRDPLDRDAVLRGTVVVRVERQADRDGGVHNGLLDRVQRLVRHDREEVLLDALEHRADVVPGPARHTPAVVVGGRAADPDHRVERVRTAEHLAPRQVQPPVRRVRLRNRVVVPVLRAVPQLPGPRRVVDGGVDVRTARLQQRHRRTRVDQPPGHHAPGRTRAHHDHVHGPSLTRVPAAGADPFAVSQPACVSGQDPRPPRARYSVHPTKEEPGMATRLCIDGQWTEAAWRCPSHARPGHRPRARGGRHRVAGRRRRRRRGRPARADRGAGVGRAAPGAASRAAVPARRPDRRAPRGAGPAGDPRPGSADRGVPAGERHRRGRALPVLRGLGDEAAGHHEPGVVPGHAALHPP